MKIRFLQDYQVKAEGGEIYKAGEVYDLPELTAQHFLRRVGRAKVVPENKPAIDEPKTVSPEPQPVKQVESKPLGTRGGDPTKKFQKGQSEYRKKALTGEDL